MDTTGKIILVIGATGQQGGATARHLAQRGWTVRGLTRDVNSEAAQKLTAQGVTVVQGDMDDRASLGAALEGVHGVFSVQNFWLPGVGAAGEVRQGKAVADAAHAAGVQHFVYTSVGSADRHTGIPHFESKWEIEQYIAALGLPATILRPVAFMDNYQWGRAYILNGMFSGFGLKNGKTIQLIAADDIGGIAAAVFENPSAYLGKAIEIAGDELTEDEVAATFTRVIGRPVHNTGQSAMPAGDEESLRMQNWFQEEGYEADIAAVRAIYPGLHSLESWLRETGWENAPAPELPKQQAWS